MLDEFIRVAYEADRNRDRSVKLAADMANLPIHELQHIVKHGMEEEERWIDKFKGTPMFDRAAQLEQASLELKMQADQAEQSDDAQREVARAGREAVNASKDQICVQKKMLELELDKRQNQAMGGGPVAPELPPEAVKAASARMRAKLASFRPVGEKTAEGYAGHIGAGLGGAVAPMAGLIGASLSGARSVPAQYATTLGSASAAGGLGAAAGSGIDALRGHQVTDAEIKGRTVGAAVGTALGTVGGNALSNALSPVVPRAWTTASPLLGAAGGVAGSVLGGRLARGREKMVEAARMMARRDMEKEAISLSAIRQTAGNVARKNPQALLGSGAGAAVGGIGAGMSGEDEFSVRRALGGAALGAAGGAAAGKAVQLGGAAARMRAQALKNAKFSPNAKGIAAETPMGWGEAARRAWNADVHQQTRALKPLGVTQDSTKALRFGGLSKGRGSQSLVPATKVRKIKAKQEALRNYENAPAAGSAVRAPVDEDDIAAAFAAKGL